MKIQLTNEERVVAVAYLPGNCTRNERRIQTGRSVRFAASTTAVNSGKHDVAHGGLQKPVRARQGFVQTGAFFQLSLVVIWFGEEESGGLAAAGSGGINLKSNPCRAADGESCITFV